MERASWLGAQMTTQPPGSTGLPLIGESLAFGRSAFNFIEERIAKYGPIFRSSVLGQVTVFINGPDACDAFIDEGRFERGSAWPSFICEIMGAPSLPVLDGETHATRKKIVMQGFSPEALASYMPDMQAILERHFDAWCAADEVSVVERSQALAFDLIAKNVIDLDSGPRMSALTDDYAKVRTALGGLPIPLPGTAFSKGRAAIRRLLEELAAIVSEHRAAPKDDGLGRILAAEIDGVRVDDDQARREMHHLFIAGFIVYAELTAIVLQLSAHPEILQRLRDEAATLDASAPLDVAQLHGLEHHRRFVEEVKRVTPVTPISFARARIDCEVGGYAIAKGTPVYLGLRAPSMDPSVWTNPSEFDPDRFSPERAEHKKHFHSRVPHGAGTVAGHKCAGYDYTAQLMLAYTVLLVRRCDWALPPQDLVPDFRLIPPDPKGRARARFTARS